MNLYFDFFPLLSSPLINELNKLISSQLFVTFYFQLFKQIDHISWSCALKDILLEFLILLVVLLRFELFELLVSFDKYIL